MTVFTQIFGGTNIASSDVSYASVTLATPFTTFSWPIETSAGANLIAKIMDVDSLSAGNVLIMPPATEVSNGETVLFNNTGLDSFIVQDSQGVQILNADAGQTWQIYLTDNTTAGGTWRAFQYGAAVSAANAASLAGTGLIALGSFLSQSMPTLSYSTNHTLTVPDRANTFIWTGGVGSFTLPLASPTSAINNWFVQFKNAGTGSLSIISASQIDGSGLVTLQPLESCIVVSDGSTYYTIGLGQSAVFAFDYTTINVSGGALNPDYVLSGAELNRVAYEFTGTLTGNRNIIVPDTIQQYWVTNSTTGSYTLTVKTATAPGVLVNQTSSTILYCNGNQVVQAESGGISLPLPVSLGGTGATNAAQAIINLGINPIDGGVF
jgi:predicted secreted protein